MKTERLYVDFHILQTVPPSCINRDDMGSAKTADFGGKRRARVSSQAWKRATRAEFPNIFDEGQLGYRTKKMKDLIAAKVAEISGMPKTDAEQLVTAELKEAGYLKEDKKDTLFFVSKAQIEAVAKAILSFGKNADSEAPEKGKGKGKNKDSSKTKVIREALMNSPSIDMCLFGRMSASDPALNVDAACQVAHAISTHAVTTEFDFYTAVDDIIDETNVGSGFMGTSEFNSCTLYRYANVNVNELLENFEKEDVIETIKGFAEAFIKSMPTGKQNSFANRTLPDLVYVTVRSDQPINLCGAFEKPVYAGTSGYMDGSKKALANYASNVYSDWSGAPNTAFFVGNLSDAEASAFGTKCTLPELLESLKKELNSKIS